MRRYKIKKHQDGWGCFRMGPLGICTMIPLFVRPTLNEAMDHLESILVDARNAYRHLTDKARIQDIDTGRRMIGVH